MKKKSKYPIKAFSDVFLITRKKKYTKGNEENKKTRSKIFFFLLTKKNNFFYATRPQSATMTVCFGVPDDEPTLSIAFTTFIPFVTFPKTTW